MYESGSSHNSRWMAVRAQSPATSAGGAAALACAQHRRGWGRQTGVGHLSLSQGWRVSPPNSPAPDPVARERWGGVAVG